MRKIKRALISVFNKSKVLEITKILLDQNIDIISTGGTQKILEENKINVTSVENITQYPSILGGRVKTLHPKIFGGILNRSENQNDKVDIEQYDIPEIDMVIVDLYPFGDTIKQTNNHAEIIEKIDIGGVSLIRAAAKNFKDIFIIPSTNEFQEAIDIIVKNNGYTNMEERLYFAKKSFQITSSYELLISKYFDSINNTNNNLPLKFKHSITKSMQLRYGENPHQKGVFYGDINYLFDKLNGKELSYNNFLDIDAAMNLINEFKEPSFGVLKHNNACGFASDKNNIKAWDKALAGDPVSAFGGILITNHHIDNNVAKKINELFFEVLIAPSFSDDALKLLKSKKNRIILKKKNSKLEEVSFRTVLNGVLCQEIDYVNSLNNRETVTNLNATEAQMEDLIFANKICKHTKSNAIVLVKDKQLIGAGCGQTSRVDALKQAILKAKSFNFSLEGAVMASDAFFPFPDCVKIAHEAGINAVIQPGGSKNDQLSIDYCNNNGVAMILTGNRHFKH